MSEHKGCNVKQHERAPVTGCCAMHQQNLPSPLIAQSCGITRALGFTSERNSLLNTVLLVCTTGERDRKSVGAEVLSHALFYPNYLLYRDSEHGVDTSS
mmetsp:Transcript_17283/g.27923  ORF Transcript_17283/g.27923 Transcript_17283/m.27923 type:complete len:99 (+) Transcript_17283:121-417(+)